jgi:radical SAM superfamily enzyme YgiQ (UPF0313 family)
MKIQLINPCINTGYEVNSRNGVMQPLGLISLATYIKQIMPDARIEILDGSIESRDTINSQLDADVVGCTTGVLSYEHALEIAEISKQSGSMVVFGGALANELPCQILSKRPNVDFVIRGDGEIAFAQLLSGLAPEKIPNLVWRKGASVILNSVQKIDLDILPFPQRHFVPIKNYFDNYKGINVSEKYFRPLSFYSGKGCLHAKQHGRCLFCARMDEGYRTRSPGLVWKELLELWSTFGADCFWDVADSIVSDELWLNSFLRCRPDGFAPKFVFYGRSDAITISTCRMLQKLNCHLLFMGFESGCNEILRNINAWKTVEMAKEAASLLAQHGIRIMASFVLGLPGETDDTIKKTVEFAHFLSNLGNLETVSASVIMPLPGSSVFKLLCKDYPQKYVGVDWYNLEEARHNWLSRYTYVSLDYLYNVLPDLFAAGVVASSLGRPSQYDNGRCDVAMLKRYGDVVGG